MFSTLTTKFALLSLVITLCGCATETGRAAAQRKPPCDIPVGGTYNDTYRAAAKIDPQKGIGECEANILANAYFFAYISLCGGTSFPKDHGYAWVATTAVGYGGAPGPPVTVKRNGVTYSPGGPIVTDPKVYLKFIRNI